MPLAVYLLGVEIFCLTTSEYMVSGLLPGLSGSFGVSVVAVGFLVTAYAAAMAVGGPVLTVGLISRERKRVLLMLVAAFVSGQVLGALAPDYGVLLAARLLTGIAAAAFFGVALTVCAQLVPPEQFGRASSTVLGGLMLGTVLGLPLETWIGDRFGWRASFWSVAVLAAVAGLLIVRFVPALPSPPAVSIRSELVALRSPRLWAVYATSLLLVGATFAGFTFLVPILREVSGFSSGMVPLLLVGYGLATIVGNTVVGRLADRWTLQVLAVGLLTLAAAMALFATLGSSQAVAVLALVLIGLAGVSMNPALVTRGARAGGNSLLVNAVHTAIIMLGVMIGSSLGGLCIDRGWGLRSPLWVGVVLAVLGVGTLLPELIAKPRRRPGEPAAERASVGMSSG